MIEVNIKILDERMRNLLPQYATPGSAALDLRACMQTPIALEPDHTLMVSTGISLHIGTPGYAAMILPRSGLGAKNGIVLGNLVGLIDSDYQGPLMMSLWNRSKEEFMINPLDRVAQLIVVPVERLAFNIVDEHVSSERGQGGFGSTGKG